MKKPSILQVIGLSQTGKTTLLTELLEKLNDTGIESATVKSARNHIYDYSSKDSDTFLKSGSENSTVVFKDLVQMSIRKQLDIHQIIELIVKLSNPEVILIEGFKELSFPKILVWSEELITETEVNLDQVQYVLCLNDCEINNKELQELIKKEEILTFNNLDGLIDTVVQDFVRGK